MLFVLSIFALVLLGFLGSIPRAAAAPGGFAFRLTLTVGTVAVAIPLFMEWWAVIDFQSGRGVALGASHAQIFVLGVGAAVFAAAFAWRAWALRASWKFDRTLFGQAVLGLAASSYLGMTVLDHFAFVDPQAGSAGVVHLKAVQEIEGVRDVTCEEGLLLVRDFTAFALDYRCPEGPIVLGRFSSTPFIPWPAYTSGESQQLAKAMTSLLKDVGSPSDTPLK